jgi:hypothetical protein
LSANALVKASVNAANIKPSATYITRSMSINILTP